MYKQKLNIRMRFDDILHEHVGDCGRYQAFIVVILCLIGIPEAMFLFDIIFSAGRPEVWCSVPRTGHAAFDNTSQEEWLNMTVPWELRDGEWKRSQCLAYNVTSVSDLRSVPGRLEATENVTDKTNSTLPLVECSTYEYDKSVFISTIVTEGGAYDMLINDKACIEFIQFDLVCDRDYLVSLTKSIMMIGSMTGVALGGVLADRFGRRTVILVCIAFVPLVRLLEVFATNLIFFASSRVLSTICTGAIYIVAFTLALEMVGARWRALVGTFLAQMYAVGFMITAFAAYFFRERWLLQIVLTAPFLLFFFLFCILLESPRWLYARGRCQEADAVLRKIARRNGTTFPDGITVTVDSTKGSAGVWQLISNRILLMRSVIVICAWFVASMCYFGMTLNIGSLAGNIYLNLFITGVLEVVAYVCSQVALGTRLGRRYTTSGFYVIAGIALLCTLAVPADKAIVNTVLSSFGRFCVAGAYNAIYIWTAELFPTFIRNTAMSSASTLGKIGSVLAPLTERLEPIWKPMPTIIFGAMALSIGLVLLVLPETRGKPLPQTVKDMQSLKK